LRVEGVAEEGGVDCLVLVEVCVCAVVGVGEEIEVDVVGVWIIEVERVGAEVVVALGAKLRAALMGNGSVGGEEGLVVEGGLLWELLSLGDRVLRVKRLPRCRHLVEGVRVGERRIKS